MRNNKVYGTQQAISLHRVLGMINKRKLYEKNRIIINLIHLQWQRNLAK